MRYKYGKSNRQHKSGHGTGGQLALLERRIYLDAEGILKKVQCVATNIATIKLQEAVASAAAALNDAGPSIRFLGFKIIDLKLKRVQITDPDKAYTSIRDGYLKRLAALGPTDSAYEIISTYANIGRLAEDAGCAYDDPTLAAMFLNEQFKYRLLAQSWAIIPVKMQANR